MSETDAERIERQKRERAEELKRVPPQKVDKSKWPADVRPISLEETDGLGIDPSGRLHWNGKPVEIVGQRLDLTRAQMGFAIAVAFFTAIAALATAVQAAVAYHDWACRTGWPSLIICPVADDDVERTPGGTAD
jgi:hypothetical protein